MRAQHLGLVLALMQFEVEGVLHRARRVEFRHVERGEVMPLVLDLRAFPDREAEVGENLSQLIHHLADRVDGAAGLVLHRK